MAEHKDLTESYIEVASHDFAEQVLNASQMVVVDFSSERSSSCQLFDPEFAAVSKEYGGRVTFAKLDVDADEALTSERHVYCVPTLIFFKNAQEVNRFR